MKQKESTTYWPDQYWENYQGYPAGAQRRVTQVVASYANPKATALELGCGRGDSTNELLVPNFGKVVAFDLLEHPAKLDPRVEYHRLADDDYSCPGIPDASIDFVWSFGVFCHLPNSALQTYLKSIWRVLKPTGIAVCMFANWPRHPQRCTIRNPEQYREVANDTWYFCDVPTVRHLASAAGFYFIDLLPDFRDTLAELRPE